MTRAKRSASITTSGLTIVSFVLFAAAGCGSAAPAEPSLPSTLTIGFGIPATDTPEHGMQAAASIIAFEGLASFASDGRPQPQLAESWSESSDGLSWRIRLRPSVVFHDGSSADAHAVAAALRARLLPSMGPAGTDISDIAASGDREVVIRLKNRSAFVPEGLEITIQDSKRPNVGTGPFQITLSSPNGLEMSANKHYYLGPPHIDRIGFKPYSSLRAAWADMLRGRVEML